MRLKEQILSVLNIDRDFFSIAVSNLGERPEGIQNAFSEIVSASVNVIHMQCVLNERTEEICRMAKDCSQVNAIGDPFLPNSPISIKGNGANSELFADRFATIVDIIARDTNLKSSSVKNLFSILTPMVLANIYYKLKDSEFTPNQLASFLTQKAKRNKISREIRLELNGLIKNESEETLLAKPKTQSFLSKISSFIWLTRGLKDSAH